MKGSNCPACRHPGMEAFYDGGLVPMHSTLLMRSREQALGFPRGKLELAWCTRCGFVSNTEFQEGRQAYSRDCEESQGCSPTFSRWLDALARRLAEEHGFKDRTVLEIGCGKGEFLASLCAAGRNRGIGYDPAYVPGRLAEPSPDIEFHERYWDRSRGLAGNSGDADAIVCRHTLEHIPAVLDFLQDLRAVIGDRSDVPVFFEVPDTVRVLREGAFWDIYYEHCSYFTMDSLCALFRRAGFEVRECWLDYGDQYLMLVAQPTTANHDSGVSDPGAGIGQSRRALNTGRTRWTHYLQDCAREKREVVLWGGGSKAAAFLNTVENSDMIRRVIDINPHKHGAYIPGTGQQVVSPGDLVRHKADVVILMNPVYQAEVQDSLDRMGCRAELLTLEGAV